MPDEDNKTTETTVIDGAAPSTIIDPAQEVPPATSADLGDPAAVVQVPLEGAAALEDPADKADPNEAFRDEIRASLKAHLESIDGKIQGFLDSEIKPLRDDMKAMGEELDKLHDGLAAATPEGAADAQAQMQTVLSDFTKLMADIKPMLERVATLESKLKHWL